VPDSADFDHVELAGQCRRECLVGPLAFHDASYRFIDFCHTTRDNKSHRFHRSATANGDRHHGARVRPLRHVADRFDRCVELDPSCPLLHVLNEFDVGVGASPYSGSTRGAQRQRKRRRPASGTRGRFRPVGFLIELTSDCPKRRFPSRRRFSIGLDTRRLSRSRCLPCGLLAFGIRSRGFDADRFLTGGLLSRGFDADRFLTGGLLSLPVQLRCRLSRSFLAFGLESCKVETSRFLTGDLLSLRIQLRCHLSRSFLAFGLESCKLETSRFLTGGLLPLHIQLRCHLSRSFLAFGLESCKFETSRFLTGGLLSLRIQLRCRLSRSFLAFGLESCKLETSRFLTGGLLSPRFLRHTVGIS